MNPQTLEQWVERYYFDPDLFMQEMWNVTPYAWQAEVSSWVKEGHRRIAISTGHGVGKTAWAAMVSIWFVLTRFPCKVVLTAPSKATLEDGLLAEVKMWINLLPDGVKAVLEPKSDRIVRRIAPDSAFISARTSREENPEALAGIHSRHTLLVCDEASGISDKVFSSGQGSMSAETATTILLGNPTRATGYFADALTSARDLVWKVREVSCLEVMGKHPNAPSPEYVEEMKLLYGENSNTYRYRVLGKLPLSDDDVIIPRELVDAALIRDVQRSAGVPVFWGLDVARLGRNESALAKRQGNFLLEPVEKFRGLDLMQTTGRIKSLFDGTPVEDRPAEILIDGIGIGAGVVDRLRELGLPATGINVSERKSHDKAYFNLKAELWWTARGWFASQMVKIPNDESLIQHLTVVKPHFASDGRLMAEPKEKTLKRIGRAEERRLDDADAFILTFAGNAAAAAYGSSRLAGLGGKISRNRMVLA